jgi:YVTN family beta-propeller protein
LYRINTETFEIEKVIKVGSVPKYVAACDNNKYVLVSNWSSGDVSVIDVESNTEIKRIKAGAFPRGIAIDSRSKYAYVAIMGGTGILKIDLDDFSTSWIREVGRAPRHLCISSNDSVLYVSLNTEGKIARINLNTNVIDKISCAGAPRSMILSPDDHFLYVVNYSADKVSKIDLGLFRLVEQQNTHGEPIGITFDEELKEIWVACYSGSIMVFADKDYNKSFDLSWIMDGVTGMYDRFSDFTGSFLADKKTKPKENKKDLAVTDAVKTKKQDPALHNVSQVKDDEPVKEKVRTEPEKTVADPVKTTTPVKGEITPAAGEIYVVVGSFKVDGNAYRLKNRLTDKGYTSVVFRNKNGMMCTALGSFGSVQSAQEALNKVKLVEKMEGWILKVDR